MLVDSHCHLDRVDLTPYDGDFDRFVSHTLESGVEHMLCVSIDLESWPQMVSLIENYPQISYSVGVHPNDRERHEPGVEELVELADAPRVVAIGETGLDYFRAVQGSTSAAGAGSPGAAAVQGSTSAAGAGSPGAAAVQGSSSAAGAGSPGAAGEGDLEWQRERFRTHVRAARSSARPLIIHTRAAKADTIRIMQEEGAETAGGVMHCFTEDWAMARQALDMGFYISFSGIVTFKNAADLREVVKQVPLEQLLIETDSPYLAPVPFRGKSNQPRYVQQVAECVAELKGLSLEALAEQANANFYRCFPRAARA